MAKKLDDAENQKQLKPGYNNEGSKIRRKSNFQTVSGMNEALASRHLPSSKIFRRK